MQKKKDIFFMAQAVFKALSAASPHLFPEDIFAKIPANHPARLVNKVVDALDLSNIIALYKGGGCSAYHPRMMLKVLFYGYFSNVYSCRKIAKALGENIHFMYLSGNSTPDFRTINDFRGKILKDKIQDIFAEVVKLLMEMGYVSLDVQYIDGTKIEARSNRYTFVWRKTVEKNKEKLEQKIQDVLADIEKHIQADTQAENEEKLPEKIDTEALREKLAVLNKKLKAPNKQVEKELAKLQEEHLPKLAEYEQHLEKLGERNSYSKTDIDATFMRLKDDHMNNGQLKPAYNLQLSTENQFITHLSIHQKPNDTTTLPVHLDSFEKSYEKQSKAVTTDAGYGSEQNYNMLEKKGIEGYVKYNHFHGEQKKKFKNNPFLVQNMFYNAENDFFVCPMGQKMQKVGTGKRLSENAYEAQVTYYQAQRCEGCPLRGLCHQAAGNRKIEVNHQLNQYKEKASALLTSEKGREHQKKRSIEVEAVFGQLKSNNNFKRFTLAGMEKVTLEATLMALGHNLRKMAA